MRPVGIIFRFMMVVSVLDSCIEPYDPPMDNLDTDFLVVDGFLNASDGTATVILTRTLPVKSTETIPRVSGATVRIEDDLGSTYPLQQTAEGLYAGSGVAIDFAKRYRLVIRTNDNREYASDLIDVTQSPAIDSITFTGKEGGVEFAVNSRDPSGRARHFRWKYEETYEYNANFNSLLKFEGEEIVDRPPEESLYTCWKSGRSTDIIVGTTKHLLESVVSKSPLTLIPRGSIKISIKYSILVEQQALTPEGYDYWLNLEKSTEDLGGLFDPLPSEVSGNMHNTTDPRDKVIGFFSASTVERVRLSVDRYDLPRGFQHYENYNPYCLEDTILIEDLPTIAKDATWLIQAVAPPASPVTGYSTAPRSCVDCRSLGGTTIRPEFWE
jgi:hypothetical protein